MTAAHLTTFKLWVFCALLLPLTFSLGLWQLDRADQKRVLLAEYMEQKNASPLLVSSELIKSAERPVSIRPYRLAGHYKGKSILLDNKIRHGVVGYDVYSPFYLEEQVFILVNRGWVAAPRLRSELPTLVTPEGLSEITGYFYQPDGEVPVLSDYDTAPLDDRPRRLQRVEWKSINTWYPGELWSQTEFRLQDSSQSGSYDVLWQITTMLPEKHDGYAFQWFSLAVAWLALMLWASYKSRGDSESSK